MRLLTWNACKGRLEQKGPSIAGLGADIAVIQEIAEPLEQSDHLLWFGSNPNQGMAVIASESYSLRKLEEDPSAPRHVIPIAVDGPTPFTLFAVWTLQQEHFRYVRAASKAIDIYTQMFADGPVVLLGDFNSNAIWDGHHPQDLNHSAMVERLAYHGLVSAYHSCKGEAFGRESEATFYLHWNENKPYHIDYCFLPSAWAADIVRVEVGNFADWRNLSDHRPLFVELRETEA